MVHSWRRRLDKFKPPHLDLFNLLLLCSLSLRSLNLKNAPSAKATQRDHSPGERLMDEEPIKCVQANFCKTKLNLNSVGLFLQLPAFALYESLKISYSRVHSTRAPSPLAQTQTHTHASDQREFLVVQLQANTMHAMSHNKTLDANYPLSANTLRGGRFF